MIAAVDAPFVAPCASVGGPWLDTARIAGTGGAWFRSMPDFNDPVIRSLPVCALAIALAIMEQSVAARPAECAR